MGLHWWSTRQRAEGCDLHIALLQGLWPQMYLAGTLNTPNKGDKIGDQEMFYIFHKSVENNKWTFKSSI